MRRFISIILTIGFGTLMLSRFLSGNFFVNELSSDYYIYNTFIEVGSRNIVTGIYLDYRLFDSIFEAGILLVAVAGVLFMSKKDEKTSGDEIDERK
jgi:multicomponent Na+:H+ antiporter subunit B